AIGDALNDISIKTGDQDRAGQGAQDRKNDAIETKESEDGQKDGRKVGTDHVDFAVREVDHADDPVDHRVANGDQPVGTSENNSVDQLLTEYVGIHPLPFCISSCPGAPP